MRTKAQIRASNRYQSYLRGWRDGASLHVPRAEFKDHATLSVDYDRGYADGHAAYNVAGNAAMRYYGHVPSILRRARPAQ